MSNNKKKGMEGFSALVDRFSKLDVIAEMEKEYQSLASKNLPLSEIDDNSYIKSVQFTKEVKNSLGESIKERGIFSPLLVRRKGSHYELILGRKRYYGAKAAGLSVVPAIICEISEEEMLLMLLADIRDQREGNILELAYIDKALVTKFHYSQQTLAKLTYQSRSQITNTMRLLSLPDPIIKEISNGELTYGHARALLGLSQEEIMALTETIHKNNLSVRETELLAKEIKNKKATSTNKNHILVSSKRVTFLFETDEERDAFLKKFRFIK